MEFGESMLNTCLWCHEQFETNARGSRFCCAEHREFFSHKRRIIENRFPWTEDREKREKELEKLEKEGKDHA